MSAERNLSHQYYTICMYYTHICIFIIIFNRQRTTNIAWSVTSSSERERESEMGRNRLERMSNYSILTLLTLCHIHWQFNNASFGLMSVEGAADSSTGWERAMGSLERKWGLSRDKVSHHLLAGIQLFPYLTANPTFLWSGRHTSLIFYNSTGLQFLYINLNA